MHVDTRAVGKQGIPREEMTSTGKKAIAMNEVVSVAPAGQREVVPPDSQSLAVKEFYFTASRICRQFFVKFLAPTFPGN